MENNNYKPMSVVDWLITMLITAIPIVGFIMLFVWAFSRDTQPSKANWAKAGLVFYAIVVAMYLVFGAAIIGLFLSSGGYESM